jgi:dolichyl-phosphate beta-glucosyltransferase
MQKKTCIIIPCYNEAKRLNGADFISYIKSNRHVCILFVNDGSMDETDSVLHDIVRHQRRNMFVLNLKQNKGKAEAVRLGVLESFRWRSFDYIGYLDADLSCPLAEINLAIRTIESEKTCRMVLGSRVKRLGAEIERNPLRHYIGRILSTFTSILLDLPVYDSQCGLKILARDYARQVFKKEFKTTWLFDCEILARLIQKYGYGQVNRSIYEMPLHSWIEKKESKIKISYLFKIPVELYHIRRIVNGAGL